MNVLAELEVSASSNCQRLQLQGLQYAGGLFVLIKTGCAFVQSLYTSTK